MAPVGNAIAVIQAPNGGSLLQGDVGQLHLPDQPDQAGDRQGHVDRLGEESRRNMNVDDAKAIALLVVRAARTPGPRSD